MTLTELRLAAEVPAVGLAVAALLAGAGAGLWLGRARPGARWWTGQLAVLALAALVLRAHPLEHRLYFDEDAYANQALNVARGLGPVMTSARVAGAANVLPAKWPGAFPILAAPAVAAFGPERGPALLNGAAGLLTALFLAAIGAALAPGGGFVALAVFGLHPVTGGWYRAGGSEPLALLFVAVSLFAALRGSRASATVERRAWLIAAVTSALLACHTRLESWTFLAALVIGQRTQLRALGVRGGSWLLPLAPLLACHGLHAASLGRFYAAGLPQSSFSPAHIADNLVANARFLVHETPATLLLLALVPFAWRRAARVERPLLVTLVGWQLGAACVLLCYSVGRLDAAGGTRLLLGPLLALSLLLAGGAVRARSALARVALGALALAYLLLVARPARDWSRWQQDAVVAAARREHCHVTHHARALPAGTVVVSELPFLWDNLGVDTVAPGSLDLYPPPPGAAVRYHVTPRSGPSPVALTPLAAVPSCAR